MSVRDFKSCGPDYIGTVGSIPTHFRHVKYLHLNKLLESKNELWRYCGVEKIVARSIMFAPLIQITVRHSADCPHEDDPHFRKCDCWKHLEWFYHGKRYQVATKSRTWAGAERLLVAVAHQHATLS